VVGFFRKMGSVSRNSVPGLKQDGAEDIRDVWIPVSPDRGRDERWPVHRLGQCDGSRSRAQLRRKYGRDCLAGQMADEERLSRIAAKSPCTESERERRERTNSSGRHPYRQRNIFREAVGSAPLVFAFPHALTATIGRAQCRSPDFPAGLEHGCDRAGTLLRGYLGDSLVLVGSKVRARVRHRSVLTCRDRPSAFRVPWRSSSMR